MKGIKINIEDKAANVFEMTQTIIRLISVTKSLTLSNTEIFALTYFVIHGYNKVTKEELITNKLFKTKNSVSNTISKFRKYGVIVKTNYGEEISKDYSIGVNDKIVFEYVLSNGNK